MANTRDFLYKLGLKFITKSSNNKTVVDSLETDNQPVSSSNSRMKDEAGTQSIDRDIPIETQENPNPLKQTIRKMPTKWERRIRKLSKFTRTAYEYIYELGYELWSKRWWREKTPQELADERERKRRKKEAATYRREADLYAKRISNAFARMGYCYVPNKTGYRHPGPRKVRFSHAVGEPNAIHLKIAHPLPHGVDILKLVNDEAVLSNVAASCRHAVQANFTPERGAWILIERGRGTRGVPNKVSYRKLMDLMPEDKDSLTVPFGEAANSRRIYKSFKPFPHMLVGGATGNGKTNYLNMILCSLIENNSPDDLQFVLVDLKNGIEFDLYEGIPHLYRGFQSAPNGIVGRNDQVLPLLRELKQEGERRLNIFKRKKVNKIEDYNRHKSIGRMSRLFFIIDEWARISQSSDGAEADQLLAEITATYRAAGYHVVVCTQMPKVKVVSTLIKTNLSARLAFGVPSNNESMVILDRKDAHGLHPAGRAIFKHGMNLIEVQTPLVERKTIKSIVSKAIETGGKVDNRKVLSMEDILRYSINNLGCSLAWRALYDQFQGQISQADLVELLQQYDHKVVNIDDQAYEIVPSNGGAKPRRLREYPPTVE